MSNSAGKRAAAPDKGSVTKSQMTYDVNQKSLDDKIRDGEIGARTRRYGVSSEQSSSSSGNAASARAAFESRLKQAGDVSKDKKTTRAADAAAREGEGDQPQLTGSINVLRPAPRPVRRKHPSSAPQAPAFPYSAPQAPILLKLDHFCVKIYDFMLSHRQFERGRQGRILRFLVWARHQNYASAQGSRAHIKLGLTY